MGSSVLSRASMLAAAGLCLLIAAAATGAQAACQLQQAAELQVVNERGSPLVKGKLDGHDVEFLIDTGAAQTSVLTDAARKLGLPMRSGPEGLRLYGAGGETRVRETVVDLEFGGARVDKLKMVVAGEHSLGDAAGLIGWDLLSHWDVEFDLAHHVIRLLKPAGCKGDEVVYWANAYSRASTRRGQNDIPEIDIDVLLNGRRVGAILDSGASVSFVTAQAAAEAGAKPETKADGPAYGVGANAVMVSTAKFDTFSVGGEEIRNARVEVGDLFTTDTYATTGALIGQRVEGLPEMMLGADFLRSHRVLIAPDQNLLYFTYGGGPVFDLRERPAGAGAKTQTQ